MGKAKPSKNLTHKVAAAYFDPAHPGSFGGKKRLLRSLGVSSNSAEKKEIENWLKNTDTYTLYQPTRSRFSRRKTIVSGKDSCWQLDLTILNDTIAKANGGMKYVLFCIDVFSRYAWAKLLPSKTGKVISDAMEKIVLSSDKVPLSIQTDKGKEFLNSAFQSFLNKYKINHYTSENNDIKAALVERLQRTIKERLHRYFNHTSSYKFIHVLDEFMTSYNNSYHSAIKLSPAEVDCNNQETIWNNLYIPTNPFANNNFSSLKKGDQVRISKIRGTFEKSYTGNWSEEIYSIIEILNTQPTTYRLEDADGEILAGTWYSTELQNVSNSNNLFKIEAIVGRRKIGRKTQLLVKWVGYPSKFNSYIDEKEVVSHYKN